MTVTETATCDQCGTTHRRPVVGWWQIEYLDQRINVWSEIPTPFHLCSFRCLSLFAARRMPVVPEPIA